MMIGCLGDLAATGEIAQHLWARNDKARRVLGWQAEDPARAVARSVRWHLANPPEASYGDLSGDDRALS